MSDDKMTPEEFDEKFGTNDDFDDEEDHSLFHDIEVCDAIKARYMTGIINGSENFELEVAVFDTEEDNVQEKINNFLDPLNGVDEEYIKEISIVDTIAVGNKIIFMYYSVLE